MRILLQVLNEDFLYFIQIFQLLSVLSNNSRNSSSLTLDDFVNNDLVYFFILAESKIYMTRVYLLFSITIIIITYIVLYDPTFSW